MCDEPWVLLRQSPMVDAHSLKKKDCCSRDMLLTGYNQPWRQDGRLQVTIGLEDEMVTKINTYSYKNTISAERWRTFYGVQPSSHCSCLTVKEQLTFFKIAALRTRYSLKQEAVFLSENTIRWQMQYILFYMTCVCKWRTWLTKNNVAYLLEIFHLYRAYCI